MSKLTITNRAVLAAIRGQPGGASTAELEGLFLCQPERRHQERLGRVLRKLKATGRARQENERWVAGPPPLPRPQPPIAQYVRLLQEAQGDASAPAVKAFYAAHKGDRHFTRAANQLRRAVRQKGGGAGG
jgi:hypothetical protein